jgi:hypothetical protein
VVNLMLLYSTVALYLANNKLEGTIPNEIRGELTKLSEYCRDCYLVVLIVILMVLFDCLHSNSISF